MARPTARRLPWTTHLVTTAVVFGWQVHAAVRDFGLEPTGAWGADGPMGWSVLLVVVAATVPLAAVEVVCADGARWVGRVVAVLVSAGVAVVAALPVGLRFFGDSEPVTRAELGSGVASLVIMVAGQTAVLLVLAAVAARTRDRRSRAVLGGVQGR